MSTSTTGKKPIARWVISGCAAALLMLQIVRPKTLPADMLTVGLLVTVLLPWLPEILSSAEIPGGWKLEFRKVQSDVNALKFLINYFLNAYEVKHLESFVGSKPQFQAEVTAAFKSELHHLRALGFIDHAVAEHPTSIRSLKEGETIDMKKHFVATETGHEYIRMRDAWLPRAT